MYGYNLGLGVTGNRLPPGATMLMKNIGGVMTAVIGESSILYQSGDASTWQTTAVWGFERTAATIAIDTALGGGKLFDGVNPRYLNWAAWMDMAFVNVSYLVIGTKGAAGWSVDLSSIGKLAQARRVLNSVDQTLLISDIITSALSDTAGTHTGQLWVPDEGGVYRCTTATNPNIQGGAWDGTKLITPTTYPTRGIRTQKGTRYPTADVAFKGLTCAPAMTNKVACRKTNPADTTNINKTGDAAATLSVVDDAAALAAAGLADICTSGKVYKLDNSAGTVAAQASIAGAANTNPHSLRVFARSTGSWVLQFNSGEGATAFNTAGYISCKKENVSPAVNGRTLQIYAPAGITVYFILPVLIEASAIGVLCAPPSAAADELASYTRPAVYATYSTAGNLFPMVDAATAQNFAVAMRLVPLRAGQSSSWMFASYVDADNYTGILVTATQVVLRKRVATVETDAVLTYTHAANNPFWVAAVLTDQGMSAKVKQDGGAWSSWVDVTTAAGQTASPVASTYQIGAINNISGFAAHNPIGPQITHLGSRATLAEYKTVAEAKLAEILI